MQISDLIVKQKDFLTDQLGEGLMQLTQACDDCLENTHSFEKLNELLFLYMRHHQHANLVYVIDSLGAQISANITKENIDTEFQGQDLSNRPFFSAIDDEHPIYISDAYISTATLKPCISVVHTICHADKIIGMLVFDLDLEKLPLPKQDLDLDEWRQIKGDPEIRSNLFNQVRASSAMDQSVDMVHDIAVELMCELGIFHLKLHYASSRATIWNYDNPYNYHVHVLDEITSPNIFLLYPKKSYPQAAKVTQEQVKDVFDKFKHMRFMDENLYLKTGSLNIMNGTVGLSFSCDGNHYLSINDFLDNFEDNYA
ncbi:hypothetical protein [uncultured Gammaproteobacteria bacterium]|uniref:PDC sensor domain-containing protein n=1 Tax=Bathymodiolus heckerae thiotrophic gill symbiont TaxID=1052212 RepID=UPI0010BBB63E|nr:hypothetical protein [Bathymodiolus heckerae thiotrophic gill symbiont]CAC9544620.1 hypothetical protein [uncultured Gammaproteobacteria bacterium]CAC9600088.1 hypothetical protein [uncultured Gammaproteobacteria bacterium]SHN89854.1 hypothetical protein BHECKSOX_2470 [Bathymodiolus heckerae thiotrophic gill symbiont]